MNEWSPYAPPRAEPAASATTGAPVYSPNQIALATFVGSTLAGTVLLALNERRLGRRGGAPDRGGRLFASNALMGFSAALPDSVPSLRFAIIGIFGIRGIAQVRQNARIEAHVAAGGRRGSGWVAFGVGLAGLVLVVGVIAGAAAFFDV